MNSSDEDYGKHYHESWTSDTAYMVFVISFAIPFIVLALLGNALILVVWLIHRPIRTPCNLYFVSLAVADLLTAFFVIPEVFAKEIPASWCKFWLTITLMFNVITPFHLIAISIDRYRTVAEGVSYLQRRTLRNVGEKLAIIWILSAWVMSPMVFDWTHSSIDPTAETVCLSKKSPQWVAHYGMISFWLPAGFLIITYRKVYVEVHRRMSHLRNTGMSLMELSSEVKASETSTLDKSNHLPPVPALRLTPCQTDWATESTPACLSVQSEDQMLTIGRTKTQNIAMKLKARERRSIITMLIISGTFILFGLPWNLASFYDAFIQTGSVHGTVYTATYVFGQVNCFVNPIIYTVRIPEFRAAFTIIRNKIYCPNKN